MHKNIPTHAVKAVIRNNENEILFLQRNPATRGEASWDLPGGLVEVGESDQETLLREINEELGLDGSVKEQNGEWSFFRALDSQTVSVTNYSVVLEDGEIQLSDEHIAYGWFTKEKLANVLVKDPSLLKVVY